MASLQRVSVNKEKKKEKEKNYHPTLATFYFSEIGQQGQLIQSIYQ